MKFLNGRPEDTDKNIEKKVKPIAEQFIKDCKAKRLTLEEFHVLAQLISWEYESAKKESAKKLSAKPF